MTTWLTKLPVSQNRQGAINGINSSVTSVGNVLGPILGALLLEYNYSYPYLLVVIVLVLSFAVTFTIVKNPKNL